MLKVFGHLLSGLADGRRMSKERILLEWNSYSIVRATSLLSLMCRERVAIDTDLVT